MLVFVSAIGDGILIADDERTTEVFGAVPEGSMRGEGVKEQDRASLNRHGHGAFYLSRAVRKRKSTVASAVVNHACGF